MNAKDVIERFCALQSKVSDYVGLAYSSDCFCGKGCFWECEEYDGTEANGCRNDGKALEFIEQAVAEKITRETQKP